jgi:hypothetical protein
MRSTSASARAESSPVSRARAQEGVTDLGRTLAKAESARVLNLSRIHMRWGQTEDYAARPLFLNRVLNRAIIMKHTPRPGELFEYVERRGKSTKVLFPLDRHDLSLGSFSGTIGQKDFSRIMSRHLDGADHLAPRDDKVLGLIDQLPTLDPFLLFALLKSHGVDVCPIYFQLTAADRQAIQTQMAEAFTPLVMLCFPGGQAGDAAAARFIEKILDFEESAEIELLREAFKLGADLFAAALFAWRGLIYYKWKTAHMDATFDAALVRLSGMKLEDPAAQTERTRGKVLTMARAAAARVREVNARYDAAFTAFVQQRHADQFRQFLINAPTLFLICGQSLAMVEHIVNFIETRPTPGPRAGGVDQDLGEGLLALERDLGADFRVKAATW